MRAELTAGAGGPPSYPPPPPPLPPREVHLVLNEDLSNLPGRRIALPTVLTFRGQTTRDRERIKLLLGYARFVRRVPGSIFTDPVEDLRHLLAQARGEPRRQTSRQLSPASSTSRPRDGARQPPRSGSQGGASTSRGRSPRRRSRSPFRRAPPSDGTVVDRIRRLEHRVDEAVRELRESARRNEEAIQRLDEFVRKRTVRRSSLQGRAAPPRQRTPVGAGESI
jgi:hypothetical protein